MIFKRLRALEKKVFELENVKFKAGDKVCFNTHVVLNDKQEKTKFVVIDHELIVEKYIFSKPRFWIQYTLFDLDRNRTTTATNRQIHKEL